MTINTRYDERKDVPLRITGYRPGYVEVTHSYPIRTAKTEEMALTVARSVADKDSFSLELFDVNYVEGQGMQYTFKITTKEKA